MKKLMMTLAVGAMLTSPAMACDTGVSAIDAAAPAASQAYAEHASLEARYNEAYFYLSYLEEDLYYEGTYPGWEDDYASLEQEMKEAEQETRTRQPAWEAAIGALNIAVSAHQAACGPAARTAELLAKHGLTHTP